MRTARGASVVWICPVGKQCLGWLLVWVTMKRRCRVLLWMVLVPTVAFAGYHVLTRANPNSDHFVGEQIDALNGVPIYFNGGVNTTRGRNLSADGYNLGIRYQCVEFVKRYLFERHQHRMPDALGNAKELFGCEAGSECRQPTRCPDQPSGYHKSSRLSVSMNAAISASSTRQPRGLRKKGCSSTAPWPKAVNHAMLARQAPNANIHRSVPG